MARLPETRPSLAREIRYQKRQLRRQGTASPFTRSGATVSGEGVTEVDGQWQSSDFDGDLANGNAGTKGWAMNAIAAAFGSLFLRPGSITNDSLANPISAGCLFRGTSNFGLTTTGGNIITINATPPAGFSQVIVFAFGRVAGFNSTASADNLYTAIDVNGVGGNQFGSPVTAGQFNTSAAGCSQLVTGLTSSSTVATHLFASTGFAAWAASTQNAADLSVSYLWLR